MMKNKTTAQRIAANINFLLEKSGLAVQVVAKRSGLSLRGLNYIRSAARSPSVDSVEAIARVFGLTSWHLLSPSLRQDIENTEWLDRIKVAFNLATPEGQELLKSATKAAESMSGKKASHS